MGQNQSRSKNSSVLAVNTYPSQEEKPDQNPPINDKGNSGGAFGCCYPANNTKKLVFDNKWKKHLIEQLDNLDLDVWPKILSKSLKKHKSNLDAFYQSDVVWAYKNYSLVERKSFSIQSVLSQSKDESLLVDNSQRNSQDSRSFYQQGEKKTANEAVQEILESSHILDEQFYNNNNKETWMDRSFNINPEHAQIITNSIKKPKQSAFSSKKRLPELYSTSPKDYTKKRIQKYKNNTFVNQLPVSVNHESSEAEDLYQNVLKYKIVTDKIDKHIKQKKTIFYLLISKFSAFFQENYDPILEKAKRKEIPNEQFLEFSERATTDLQQFVRIMFEGLCSYYKFESLDQEVNSGKEVLFNRDNLINFVTSLVLVDSIYSRIFEFYKQEDIEREEIYQKNLKPCKKLQPQDFGIPEEYCLNDLTVKYFVSKGMISEEEIAKKKVYQPILSNYPELMEENKTLDQNPLITKSSEKKEILPNKQAEKYYSTKTQPYEEAITILANLKHRNSPIHKLKTVVKVAEAISKCIEKFYEGYGIANTQKLDADQTLSIFLYIVSKSGTCDLLAHCKIIERFSTNNILNSVSGYYATTLEACVNCISAMNFQNQAEERSKPGFKDYVKSLARGSVAETPKENYN